MKKALFIISLLAINNAAFAQQKLFYFINEDSTAVGVKDDAGKIIIPAKFTAIVNYDFENPISDSTIEFYGTSFKTTSGLKSPASAGGEVYNRKGEFLYFPLLFDNGPDYWQEGVRRYVENGKVGFVNKLGNKLIKAQWDFAMPFNYGYAEVYEDGWEKKYEAGGEHWTIVPSSENSISYLVNKKGERVKGSGKPQHTKDYFFNGKYYSYPFVYNSFEQKIVDSLNSLDVLNDINLVNNYTDASRKEMLLQFEIVEYPRKDYRYYVLQGFVRQMKSDNSLFAVSQDGTQFFTMNHFDKDDLKPLKQWIIEELQNAKKFMKSHKDSKFRFDADKALKKLRNN